MTYTEADAVRDLIDAIQDEYVWLKVPQAATRVVWKLRMIAKSGKVRSSAA